MSSDRLWPWRCRACKGPPISGNAREKPWVGPCPHCGRSCNADRIGDDPTNKKSHSTFASAAESKVEYVSTGLPAFDSVLGGGLVASAVILLGGYPGAGKSTLLTTLADTMSKRRKVVYASSEQSDKAVVQIANRVGATSDNVVVLGNQGCVEDTLQKVKSERAFLGIWDSLQKYTSRLSAGVPGSASQGTAVAAAIKADCRSSGRCAIIVNQMSRSGSMKGGLDVEHDMDTVMVLAYPKEDDEDAPGDEADGVRMLVVEKNRNGPENLRSYWSMTEAGVLEHVPARSKLITFPTGKSKYSGRKRTEQDEDEI